MDQLFLPQKIKAQLETLAPGETPSCIVRSNGSLEGKSGEGYLLSFADRLIMFSKSFGEGDYSHITYQFSAICNMAARQEKYCLILAIRTSDKLYDIKISRLEDDDTQNLITIWHQSGPHDAPPQPAPPLPVETETAPAPPPLPVETTSEPTAPTLDTAEPIQPQPLPAAAEAETIMPSTVPSAPLAELSPLAGLAAALMFLSTVDSEIDQSEDDYIRHICLDNSAILQEALSYYKAHTYDDLLVEMTNMALDNQQKLCMYAHLCELGMSDGILHSSEQRLLQQYANTLELSDDETQTVLDVLLIKNQISVLAD